jgi:hypothetical protein
VITAPAAGQVPGPDAHVASIAVQVPLPVHQQVADQQSSEATDEGRDATSGFHESTATARPSR